MLTSSILLIQPKMQSNSCCEKIKGEGGVPLFLCSIVFFTWGYPLSHPTLSVCIYVSTYKSYKPNLYSFLFLHLSLSLSLYLFLSLSLFFCLFLYFFLSLFLSLSFSLFSYLPGIIVFEIKLFWAVTLPLCVWSRFLAMVLMPGRCIRKALSSIMKS